MRISDWSSDVCSSDLHRHREHDRQQAGGEVGGGQIEEVEVEGEHAESHGEQQPMGAPGKAERVACEQGPEEDHCSGDREAVGDGEFRRQQPDLDRKSVVKGKSVSVRVDLGGSRIIKKNKYK